MRGHRIAVVGLVLLVLLGCGGSDDSDGEDTGDSTSGATEDGGTTTPSGDPDSGGDDEVSSVTWGPDDPPIPGEYAAFAVDAAEDLACESIDGRADDDRFFALAADICRVFRGDGDWPEVDAVPPLPDEGNSYQRCLDEELSDVLQAALSWHERHPGNERPVVRYPGAGQHSACQTRLYEVGVSEEEIDDEGCDNDDGPSAPPSPGVAVTFAAPGMLAAIESPRVRVDGAPPCLVRDRQDDALRIFVVVVPAPEEAEVVTIEVETSYGTLRQSVALPAGGGDTPPTTEEEDPATTEEGPETTADDDATSTTGEGSTTTDGE